MRVYQVTDTTTFTDEKKRAEVDSWLYETCTQCLQHMVDVFVQFFADVHPLLPRILDLLANFIRCWLWRHVCLITPPLLAVCNRLARSKAVLQVPRLQLPGCLSTTGMRLHGPGCCAAVTCPDVSCVGQHD